MRRFVWPLYASLFLLPAFQAAGVLPPGWIFRQCHYLVALFTLIAWSLNRIDEPAPWEKKALLVCSLFGFSVDSLSHYFALDYTGTDFSIFSTLLQNFWGSRLGYSEVVSLHHLGVHQNWLLLPLSPFVTGPNPAIVLILIAAIVLWVTGIFLLRLVPERRTAWMIAVAWWTGSYTSQSLHGRFYPEYFYAPLMCLLVLSVVNGKRGLTLFFLTLCLLVKEDAAFYGLGLAIFFAWKKQWKHAGAVASLAAGFLIFNLSLARPYFLNQSAVAEPQYFVRFWGQWGATAKDVILGVLKHPWEALKAFWASPGWKELYGPMLFIPLFHPMIFFMSLPVIGLYGLARGMPSEYGSYYPLVLWILALMGLVLVLRSRPKILGYFLLLVPLFGYSSLEAVTFDYAKYKNLRAVASELRSSRQQCLQNVLWPYFEPLGAESEKRHWVGLSSSAIGTCDTVAFSKVGTAYPATRPEWDELIALGESLSCLEQEAGDVLVFRLGGACEPLREKTRALLIANPG